MQNLLRKIKVLWPKSENAEPWQIKAARYCVEHDTFDEPELVQYIMTELKQDNVSAVRFLQENIHFPPGSTHSRINVNGGWYAPMELVSMVTDYDELKEARKNAKNAWFMSLVAIVLTAIGLYVQIQDAEINEVASRAERINQMSSINNAVQFCKSNPESIDSGLYGVKSGQLATCAETLKLYGN